VGGDLPASQVNCRVARVTAVSDGGPETNVRPW
jgi:hypothetical protein